MKTAICSLAKREEVYINDWIAYHLGIGYDRIYIYDNNDTDYPPLAEAIEPQLRDRVVIEDWRGYSSKPTTPNVQVYNDWLARYGQDFDWCTFIDIDEFVRLECGNIANFLKLAPENCNFIALNWHIYGDDGVIEGDESVPVYERFKKVVTGSRFGVAFKSTVRCKRNIKAHSPHTFWEYDNESYRVPTYYDGNLEIVPNCDFFLKYPLAYKNYVAHYMTKSLSEFLKYKCFRVDPVYRLRDKTDYFFMINKRTEEKMNYIREYLNTNHLNL